MGNQDTKPVLGLSERSGGRRLTDLAQNVSTDGMPWQVRAVALIGVPAAIACFLVWFLAVKQTAAMEGIGEILKPHIAVSQELSETLKALEVDHRDSNIRLESYMRLMCVQSAKTAADRRDCLSVR